MSPFAQLYAACHDFMLQQRAERDRSNPPADDAATAIDDLRGLVNPNAVILGRDAYLEMRAHPDALQHFELAREPGKPDKVMGLCIVRSQDPAANHVAYVPGLS